MHGKPCVRINILLYPKFITDKRGKIMRKGVEGGLERFPLRFTLLKAVLSFNRIFRAEP